MSAPADIRFISTAETMPLRCAILRPNRPPESAQFPGDNEPTTRHLGAFRDGNIVGIASLYAAEFKERPGVSAYQLRGMATAPEVRGERFGWELVLSCIRFARENEADILWCNARTGAVGFYRKLGFETIGDEFEYPDVGPHFRMWRAVAED